MTVLLVTFELSDSSKVLAWQARLARALASRCERLICITESLGAFTPPPNVEVHVVPRLLTGPLRLAGVRWLMNPAVYALCRARKVDVCFVHMAMEWAYRLKPALAAAGVPVVLWYAHGTVSRRLRVAHLAATRVVTSSHEGFRLPSDKLSIIGQGIDTALFTVPSRRALSPHIVYVGRVTPRKRVDLMLDVFARARERAGEADLRFSIVGPCLGSSDREYQERLVAQVEALGITEHVEWIDYMPPTSLRRLYETASLHLNLSETGSLDKTVLEALSCGCPVLTNNLPFERALASVPEMYARSTDADTLAARLVDIYRNRHSYDPEHLHTMVAADHGFDAFVGKIVNVLHDVVQDRP